MVVKVKKSGIPPVLFYSIGGGFAAIVTVIFAARSVLVPDHAPGCSQRYQNANTLPYAVSSGQPMTSLQLQSRLMELDWGLRDNANFTKVSAGPGGVAMEVALPKGGNAGGTVTNPVSGVGFKWTPRFLRKAARACVSYNIWMPVAFKFGSGGVLPGLYGGNPMAATQSGRKPYFATRMKWYSNGKIGVRYFGDTRVRGIDLVTNDPWFKLPRGRWVSLEQEIVLNTPGKQNGVLRVWVDGELKVEKGGLEYRDEDAIGFDGVWATTHYAGRGSVEWAPSPTNTSMLVTPMVVHWQ